MVRDWVWVRRAMTRGRSATPSAGEKGTSTPLFSCGSGFTPSTG